MNDLRAKIPFGTLHPNYLSVVNYVEQADDRIVESLLANLLLPARQLKAAYMEEGLWTFVSKTMKERETYLKEKLKMTKWEVDGAASLAAIVGTTEPVERVGSLLLSLNNASR